MSPNSYIFFTLIVSFICVDIDTILRCDEINNTDRPIHHTRIHWSSICLARYIIYLAIYLSSIVCPEIGIADWHNIMMNIISE